MLHFLCLPAFGVLVAGCAFDDEAVEYSEAPASEGVQMTFDSALWQDEERYYSEPYPRQQMLESVRSEVLVTGQSKEDVVDRLGPPTDTEKFADHGLVYWIGPEKGVISVDYQWLVIDFDEKGGLSSVAVTTD